MAIDIHSEVQFSKCLCTLVNLARLCIQRYKSKVLPSLCSHNALVLSAIFHAVIQNNKLWYTAIVPNATVQKILKNRIQAHV